MKCKVKSTTIQADCECLSLFDGIVTIDEVKEQLKVIGEESMVVSSFVDGTLSKQDGRFVITYMGESNFGTNDVKTKLSFEIDNPSEIFVEKFGEISSFMSFREGERTFSVLKTPFIPFEICTLTTSVQNDITEKGGKLSLSYLLEIKGATVQKTVLQIEVQKV